LSEGAKGSRIVTVILVVLVVALLALSGYLYMKNIQLSEDIAKLQVEVQTLTSEKQSLQSQLQQLISENNQLKSEVSSLQSQISVLNDQIYTLQRVVNLEVSEAWYSDETFNLPALTYMPYTLYPGRAGYFILTFTATQNITITVDGYYEGYRYHLEWNLAHGTIIIPVLPGRVEISFHNFNWFSGVTVTFDLTYVY